MDDAKLSRKQAFLAMLPFLALGIADVILLLGWGLDPLWGFMILPPILFVSVLAWIAFRSGFIHEHDTDYDSDLDGELDSDPE